MKEERQRLRLFVCMKTRTDGRSCCADQGLRSFSTNCGGRFCNEERRAPTSMSDRVVVLIGARTVQL